MTHPPPFPRAPLPRAASLIAHHFQLIPVRLANELWHSMATNCLLAVLWWRSASSTHSSSQLAGTEHVGLALVLAVSYLLWPISESGPCRVFETTAAL